jgi:hypothetical protein
MVSTMFASGHSRRFDPIRPTSAFGPIASRRTADILNRSTAQSGSPAPPHNAEECDKGSFYSSCSRMYAATG